MNFLNLTNRVLRRLNEVELTSASFSAATLSPPQAAIKDAVNDALHDIYTQELVWPFNISSTSFTFTSGTYQYNLSSVASTYAHVDTLSFFIAESVPASTDTAQVLKYIDYNTWFNTYLERDRNATSASYGKPDKFYITPDEKLGFTPVPASAYQVRFTFYSKFTELSAYSDTPSVPERYDHVIIDGAMMHGYLYREDFQQANYMEKRFRDGIKRMRLELIPQDKSMKAV